MALRKPVLGSYAVWIALLIAVYYAAPGARPVTWGLISLSGVAAIIVGVRLNRPARKSPWLLLAAGLSCFAAGQLTFLVAAKLHVTLPFPSFADILYLSSYPLYAVGLLLFIRRRAPHGDTRTLIDALTLTVGLALLSWTFLIRPDVTNTGMTWLQKAVAIAYPLGDVLLLALLARLLAPGAGRIRSVRLLTLGAVACLVSDSAYAGIQLYGPFHNGTIVDLGWALFYSAWGAAALTPDMTKLTEAAATQLATVSPARLALLMLASLIAPIVMLTALPGDPSVDVSVIAVFSAVLYLLVLFRLWDAAASHRRALDRERVLRQAGLSLVTAADPGQLGSAVQRAAAALLDGHARGDAVLGVRDDGALRAVDTTSPRGEAELGQLAEAWRPLLTGTSPVLVPMGTLPDEARTVRPDARWMLMCPLTLRDGHSEDPDLGVIAVFAADRRVLADLTATVQIFAQQVALTLRAMTLRQEVVKQGKEAYFRALVQDASEAIVIVGDDGTVRYATPSTAAIFGATPVPGSRFWNLIAADERDSVAREFSKLQQQGSGLAPQTVDQQITRLDGRRVQIQGRCSDLRADPSVAGFVFTLRDVTEQHELQEQLKHRAFHDALTGLPNRILFQDRIAQQVASTARTGLVAAVLFIDVDDFKLVNDTMGHSVGDELLVAVADRLAALTRASDTAARLGGDEFALLIGNAADADAAEAAAERVVTAFAEPFALEGGLVSSTVTVGVATTLDSDNTDDLLRHADLALYAAKAAGKRTWRRYQPVLGAGMVRRREVQEALEEAAATSAFTVSYQPIVSLDSGELAGLEALIRWPHPQWGMMLPGQFISLAEDTGLIIDIGAWVLERATADLARWRDEAARAEGVSAANGDHPGLDLYVSVNVSARQFADPGFADTVRRVLAVTGLDPEALTLELTETALLPRDERLLADLSALKDIGVRLALDDFGTGYSSLSYLGELPIDVVKMDKSFVEGIAESPQRLALASGIVQIAQTLNLQVVAEGIETETQRDLLAAMGCHFGQGYLLAMPMPADQAAELAHTGLARSGAGN